MAKVADKSRIKSISEQELRNAVAPVIGKSVTLKKVHEELKTLLEEKFPDNYYLDGDILKWFVESIVNAEINQFYSETGEYPLSIKTKHEDVVSYLVDEGEYLELTLIRALQETIKKIKNGYFDKKGTYLVIPLSTLDKDGNKCVLKVYRYTDGELSVRVDRENSECVWRAGYAFLTSNKSS